MIMCCTAGGLISPTLALNEDFGQTIMGQIELNGKFEPQLAALSCEGSFACATSKLTLLEAEKACGPKEKFKICICTILRLCLRGYMFHFDHVWFLT